MPAYSIQTKQFIVAVLFEHYYTTTIPLSYYLSLIT